jgi:hypothetical protein
MENQNPSIANVAIITGVIEPKFQAKTEQVLRNMLNVRSRMLLALP